MKKVILTGVILSSMSCAMAQTKPTTTPAATPKPAPTTTTTPAPAPAPRPSNTPSTSAAPQVITVQVPTPEAAPQEDLKPSSGDVSAEVNFTPFGGSPIGISYIRGRYFIDDLIALRAGVTFAFQALNLPANTDAVTYSGGGSVISWGLLPGIEFHFEGTRRLSPFVGVQLDLLARHAGYTQTTTPTGGTASTFTVNGAANSGTGADMNRANYFNPGVSGLLGCDFYFAKHIYIGTEFGLGLSIQTRGDIVVSNTSSGTTTSTTTKGAATLGIAPVYNSAIRVGFVF